MQCRFSASGPNRVWFCDITQHRARYGRVYCSAVIDAYSHLHVGCSIRDHLRSEIVVDSLEMSRSQRKPAPGTIFHSDRGAQYTSWIFADRMREAGLLGSMGKVAAGPDNPLIKSFWSSMQAEFWTTGFSSPPRYFSGLKVGVSPSGATLASE